MPSILPIIILIGTAMIAAIQAIRSKSLIQSALWLAGVSAISSIVFYLFGARQVAVIELSVGAGLVTVLFVFAISIAGEEGIKDQPLVPKPLAWCLIILSVFLLSRFSFPFTPEEATVIEPSFTTIFWQYRGIDVLVQVILIFSGALGLLRVLEEAKAPLDQPMADEIAAEREKELQAMERQSAESGANSIETSARPG
jgi:NADH:ubiquinone oxidoreductase subunit 6 (subunit J)